jgi:hypothetical protein
MINDPNSEVVPYIIMIQNLESKIKELQETIDKQHKQIIKLYVKNCELEGY